MKIFNSASKIVFIVIAITLCATFSYEVFVKTVVLESKDFLALAGMAFVFYFTNKGDSSQPFAGK